MKRIIPLFLIIFLIMPAASAGINISFDEWAPFSVHIDNATIISQKSVPDAIFTSDLNYSLGYHDAVKVTYKTDDGKTDYFIFWKADSLEYLTTLEKIHELDFYYSDYAENGVFFIEVPYNQDYAYGVLMDCQNVSYNESELIYDVLQLHGYDLTYNYLQSSPISWQADSFRSHYNGPVINPYEVARNDPYAYYDYFDYEDNVDIDEYLYDSGYTE